MVVMAVAVAVVTVAAVAVMGAAVGDHSAHHID
eukprot:COSAG02_NODE_277_length_25939_cov_108.963971_14_plen_33_part_00